MKYIVSIAFVLALLSASGSALAVVETDPGDVHESEVGVPKTIEIHNPIMAGNIQQLFEALIDIVLVFAVPIVVFFIIYAGFLYVTARGNESVIEQAHKALLFALIGGILILGARVLITVVQGTVDSIR